MGRFVKNFTLQPTGSYSVIIPNGTSSLGPEGPVNGQFRYNSTTANMQAYFGGAWKQLAVAGNSTILKDAFTGDGSTTGFTMTYSYNSGQEAQALVFIGGVFQNPGVNYTFGGTTTATFTSPPPFGQAVVILHNFASTQAA